MKIVVDAMGGDFAPANIVAGVVDAVKDFSVSVTLQRLIVLAASVILIAGLYAFLNYTRFGKAIVATAQSPKGAALVGIDLDRIYMTTFAISSGLAGAAGAIFAAVGEPGITCSGFSTAAGRVAASFPATSGMAASIAAGDRLASWACAIRSLVA